MFHPITPHWQGMTLIYRTAGLLEAEVIKGRLESSGIPVVLDYESVGPVIGIIADGLGEVRLLVLDQHAEAARELLAASADDEQPTDAEQETP